MTKPCNFCLNKPESNLLIAFDMELTLLFVSKVMHFVMQSNCLIAMPYPCFESASAFLVQVTTTLRSTTSAATSVSPS